MAPQQVTHSHRVEAWGGDGEAGVGGQLCTSPDQTHGNKGANFRIMLRGGVCMTLDAAFCPVPPAPSHPEEKDCPSARTSMSVGTTEPLRNVVAVIPTPCHG